MDRATMERLLIDRRLGELPPDTQRLLDAYLQFSPADAAVTEEIDAILDLAAQALRPEPPAAPKELPPFSLPKPITSSPAQPTRWLALAASIALAFYLGTRSAQSPTATLDRPGDIVRLSPVSTAETAEFWSVAKFVSDRARPQTADGARIEWTSPLVWPQIGVKL